MITRRELLHICTVSGASVVAGCGFFDEEEPGRLILWNQDDREYGLQVQITSQDDGSVERVDEYELEPDSRRTIRDWLTEEGLFVVDAELDTGESDGTDRVEGGRGTCRITVDEEGSLAVTWQEGD